MHARRFVRAVLAPHHAENAKLGECRHATAQQLLDLGVLLGRQAVLPNEFRSNGRVLGRSHGWKQYCRMETLSPVAGLRSSAEPVVGRWSGGRPRPSAIPTDDSLRAWGNLRPVWGLAFLCVLRVSDFANDRRPLPPPLPSILSPP